MVGRSLRISVAELKETLGPTISELREGPWNTECQT